MVTQHLNILLIENSGVDADKVRKILSNHMFHLCHVRHVKDLISAELVLKENGDVDLILLDLGFFAVRDGADILHRVESAIEDVNKEIPIVILTDVYDHELATSLIDEGAEDMIKKSTIGKNPGILCDIVDFSVCRHKHIANLMKKKNSELEEKNNVIQWVTGSYSVMK